MSVPLFPVIIPLLDAIPGDKGGGCQKVPPHDSSLNLSSPHLRNSFWYPVTDGIPAHAVIPPSPALRSSRVGLRTEVRRISVTRRHSGRSLSTDFSERASVRFFFCFGRINLGLPAEWESRHRRRDLLSWLARRTLFSCLVVRQRRMRSHRKRLIENASDRVPLRRESVLSEAFPIKPSDNSGVEQLRSMPRRFSELFEKRQTEDCMESLAVDNGRVVFL
jgi:hypothetical protein